MHAGFISTSRVELFKFRRSNANLSTLNDPVVHYCWYLPKDELGADEFQSQNKRQRIAEVYLRNPSEVLCSNPNKKIYAVIYILKLKSSYEVNV